MSGDAPKPLRCSFCDKSQHDVRKLIVGPGPTICDECVGLCVEIIQATPSAENRRLALETVRTAPFAQHFGTSDEMLAAAQPVAEWLERGRKVSSEPVNLRPPAPAAAEEV